MVTRFGSGGGGGLDGLPFRRQEGTDYAAAVTVSCGGRWQDNMPSLMQGKAAPPLVVLDMGVMGGRSLIVKGRNHWAPLQDEFCSFGFLSATAVFFCLRFMIMRTNSVPPHKLKLCPFQNHRSPSSVIPPTVSDSSLVSFTERNGFVPISSSFAFLHNSGPDLFFPPPCFGFYCLLLSWSYSCSASVSVQRPPLNLSAAKISVARFP
ncbi:hypothetical protein Nepgr_023729 [Nepenthes gracilis]|uniref:Uncharacterized protein n=1 Tax=Nepenthes gracilis TaxID=150966 RepID=A0AAD3XZQ7_NEPGR|nr:hypothetical protein Nepgr_023729 [Nepenthes gracilis]